MDNWVFTAFEHNYVRPWRVKVVRKDMPDEKRTAIEILDIRIEGQKNILEKNKVSLAYVGPVIGAIALLGSFFISAIGLISTCTTFVTIQCSAAGPMFLISGFGILFLLFILNNKTKKIDSDNERRTKAIAALLNLKEKLVRREVKTDIVSTVSNIIEQILR